MVPEVVRSSRYEIRSVSCRDILMMEYSNAGGREIAHLTARVSTGPLIRMKNETPGMARSSIPRM